MYSISEVEKISGIPASTLRYYEQEGILPKINRDAGGRRQFSEEELEWVELVIALKDTGMSIDEIKSYMDLIMQGDETLIQRRDFLAEHKNKVEQTLAKTQFHLEKIIRKMAIYEIVMSKKKSKRTLI